jgi:hypothetical protein
MTKTLALLAVTVLTLGPVSSRADRLLLDGIELDAQSASQRPRSGMTMDNVERTYGQPTERRGAVGEPPITRWDYPDFSVYFEHDRVIHAVARH